MGLDDSMGYLVRRTYRAFTRTLAQRLEPHDITISMWFFLRLLWEGDGQTQKELGEELGLTQPTTVSAMDNLERRDFIVRRRNPDDRRKINIFLTAKGKALKGQLIGYADEVNKIALAGLSPGDVGKLRRYLHALNRSLNTSFEASATGRGTGKRKPKTARKVTTGKAKASG